MRLFTALDLPGDVIENLSGLLDRLRPTARIQWSVPANLHVTTKFIGNWPDEQFDELKQGLQQIEPRAPIAVRIRNLGFFPNARSPRVFWCGIEAPGLEDLATATDKATSPLGIPSENRPFSPHLTLARIKEPVNLDRLRQTTEALPLLDFGSFEANSFFLYQSQLRPTGSVYTKLAEFPFSQR